MLLHLPGTKEVQFMRKHTILKVGKGIIEIDFDV